MRTLFFLLILVSLSSLGQTLNVPVRPATALSGSQLVSAITSLSLHDREEFILNEVLTGNVPNFQRNMILIEDSALISGSYVQVSYYVIPDYLALGSNSDYYLCPMTPILAQRLADSIDCVLPTRKMVDHIWSHASVKMTPESIPPSPQMTTVPVMSDHNDMVWTQRQTFFPGNPLGDLVAGNKKDVVLSNQIYSGSFDNVVIYGWHYPNGSNIQPLYNGHINEYADYSHGIRFVQKEVYVDGSPMSAENVLSSTSLYSLLSDEGVISQPFYPDTTSGTTTPPLPSVLKSFCVLQNSSTAIDISIAQNSNIDAYEVYLSTDGINYSFHSQHSVNSFTVSGLQPNTVYYVKLLAENSAGVSSLSEVLGTVTTDSTSKYLIVNGFDRGSTGNTYDFIRQHGTAIWNDTIAFSSATNEAVLDGLVTLSDYPALDYILGEESTIDETFDYNEQDLIEVFLDGGGYLFVSGAELAWDLHYQGSVQDQTFFENYLKSYYVDDAPNGLSGMYYQFEGMGNGLFDTISSSFFDDGTHGTYDVNYPDVLLGVVGGIEILQYSNVSNQSAGVMFEGRFPGASVQDTGKLVIFGFPFETIYPASKRLSIMSEINEFFFPELSSNNPDLGLNYTPKKITVYPNPSSSRIYFEQVVDVAEIFSLEGKKIMETKNTDQVDLTNIPNGLYLLKIKANNESHQTKIQIIH
ncbi:T9SS type A sorting domain-containing protein [Parvicella tangerina]|uniref:Fibronectin type-III domain-containing protein n=1 Tax=Parvicella tangerina TaxID=2829795 RepID=A0A916JPD7_9FLAO|nr:T9SS type A sorting domain-containing protein [Parvicella tangerina]CAG5082600.1 hypothetical protein CRYO30217_01961 [Parvicella tangerina]